MGAASKLTITCLCVFRTDATHLCQVLLLRIPHSAAAAIDLVLQWVLVHSVVSSWCCVLLIIGAGWHEGVQACSRHVHASGLVPGAPS